MTVEPQSWAELPGKAWKWSILSWLLSAHPGLASWPATSPACYRWEKQVLEGGMSCFSSWKKQGSQRLTGETQMLSPGWARTYPPLIRVVRTVGLPCLPSDLTFTMEYFKHMKVKRSIQRTLRNPVAASKSISSLSVVFILPPLLKRTYPQINWLLEWMC